MEGSPNFGSFDVLGKGEGGNTRFEIAQSILSFLTRSVCPQEKLFDQSLTDLGYRTEPTPSCPSLLHGRREVPHACAAILDNQSGCRDKKLL